MYYLPCNDDLIFLDNGWVVSVWDTISNIVYLVMGIAGMFFTHRDTLRRLNITTAAEFRATARPLVTSWNCTLLYAWIIVIGMASTVYHSTLQPWSLCMDFFAIKIFALLIIWSLGHAMSFFHGTVYLVVGVTTLAITGGLMGIASLWPEMQRYSTGTYNVLVTMLMGTVYALILYHLSVSNAIEATTWEESVMRKYHRQYHRRARHNLITSTSLFVIALVFYFLPKVACDEYRHSEYAVFMKMHAYWHVFSAISLYFCVRAISFLYHGSG
jgi:hypothetical protein